MIQALFYIVVAFWGLMMVAVALLNYKEPKIEKRKDMDWSCAVCDWVQCINYPLDELGKCSKCGKS
tara:strand:+ start:384 stop:581 length:198 start_codon:yes stop_codon:yes gene_type:complete